MPIFEDTTGNIHYEISGNGPILVLLNGIMMSTKSWEIFKDPLSEHVTLVRLDFYDQGMSSSLDEAYDLSLQVDMCERLFDYLNLENIHLAGISYGASIAMQYAVRFETRLQTLTLFNGVAKTSDWLKDIGRGWNQVAALKNGEAYYHITIPYIYSDTFYNDNQNWMQSRKKSLIEVFSDDTFLKKMIRLTNSAENHDVLDKLPNLEIPVTVVSSEKDFLTPPSEQEIIVKAIKNARFVMIPNAGHASMYEAKDLFMQILLGTVFHKKITVQL